MRIGIILDEKFDSGGGYNQSFNTLMNVKKSIDDTFELIILSKFDNTLKSLYKLYGFKGKIIKKNFIDYLLIFILYNDYKLLKRLFFKFKKYSPYEKKILNLGVDFLIFTSPTSLSPLLLIELNYISTVWDNCHRDYNEFPEIKGNVFEIREIILKEVLLKSFRIITDSIELSQKLSMRYNVDFDKFIDIPFNISPFLRTTDNLVQQKFQLFDDYLFYPAQYWPHKNHISLLKAILILKKQNLNYNLILCGKDYGTKNKIEKFITENNLLSNVLILDFVNNDEMKLLYKNCRAVVMTTYFGPTNLPPIEAWFYKKPLIYSKHLSNQTKFNSAILVDVDSPDDIANGIKSLIDIDIINQTILGGTKALSDIENVIASSQLKLNCAIKLFKSRRENW